MVLRLEFTLESPVELIKNIVPGFAPELGSPGPQRARALLFPQDPTENQAGGRWPL